jgi:ubiquinone/menaquinone biosynthesis C-methylase UbiE
VTLEHAATIPQFSFDMTNGAELMRSFLMRMFGRPEGVLGRLGGIIMGRMNADCGAWVSDFLAVGPNDSVLEVGFGPGVTIQRLSKLAAEGHVAGIDQSREMVEQARARNTTALQSGHVDLRFGAVESLPFDGNSFDKALATNSMQVWADAVAGLREIWRVMKPGGKIALGFTAYSGQPNRGFEATLIAAGFTKAQVVETGKAFCVLATKP